MHEQLRGLDHARPAAASGAPRTLLAGQPHVDLPRRAARHQRRRRGHDRPQRPDRQHDLRRHRRGQHLRLRLRRRRRPLQVDQRRHHLDRPARQGRAAAARASARSSSSPATRRPSTSATTTALRGMSSVCCTGVTRPVPDAGEVGPVQVAPTAARPGRSSTTARPTAAECTGSAAEFNNTRGLLAARRAPRRARPANPNIVYACSYARGIWRSPDAGATWTQIKPSLNPAIIQTRPAFDVTTLPNGKTRMYVYEGNTGTPYSPAVPQRRRRHRRAGRSPI